MEDHLTKEKHTNFQEKRRVHNHAGSATTHEKPRDPVLRCTHHEALEQLGGKSQRFQIVTSSFQTTLFPRVVLDTRIQSLPHRLLDDASKATLYRDNLRFQFFSSLRRTLPTDDVLGEAGRGCRCGFFCKNLLFVWCTRAPSASKKSPWRTMKKERLPCSDKTVPRVSDNVVRPAHEEFTEWTICSLLRRCRRRTFFKR